MEETPIADSRPPARTVLHHLWVPVGVLVLLSGCRFGAPEPGSAQGEDVLGLYQMFVWTAIAVGGITYALIIWAALRYRRRRGDDGRLPRQFRYNIPLEVTYTAIPVLIVAGLFVLTVRTESRVDRLDPEPAVILDVTGFKWQWRFDYPRHGVSVVGTPQRNPTILLPVGQTVRVNLAAVEVIHAFYVPEFLFKRDAIPGFDNQFDLVLPREGRFRGVCAEYCGLDHDAMNFFIQAVPVEEFEAWTAEQREAQAEG